MFTRLLTHLKHLPQEWRELTDEERAFTKGLAAGMLTIIMIVAFDRALPEK